MMDLKYILSGLLGGMGFGYMFCFLINMQKDTHWVFVSEGIICILIGAMLGAWVAIKIWII